MTTGGPPMSGFAATTQRAACFSVISATAMYPLSHRLLSLSLNVRYPQSIVPPCIIDVVVFIVTRRNMHRSTTAFSQRPQHRGVYTEKYFGGQLWVGRAPRSSSVMQNLVYTHVQCIHSCKTHDFRYLATANTLYLQ